MRDRYPNFIPQWTKAVRDLHIKYTDSEINKYPEFLIKKEFGLDWYESGCCLVGEAFFNTDTTSNEHAHDVSYCKTCVDFALDLSLDALNSVQSLNVFKKSLAEHLQYKHEEIWDEWNNGLPKKDL